MGFKFKLTLYKVYELDTERDWSNDHTTLIETLRSSVGVEPGNQADADQIHDAIRSMLEDDIEYVVDLDLDANDFEISVPDGTTVEVPAEEDEE